MKSLILIGLGVFLGLFYFAIEPSAVTFESLESKTMDEGPVFNQIRFLPSRVKDIWLMRQTHHGFLEPQEKWDRLAIVVDKHSGVATFYELAPNENLEFEAKPIPYKARCLACHANGPRAIRPNYDSADVLPSVRDRIKIALWNLRIKTYGQLQSRGAQEFSEGVPFQSKHALFLKPLHLATCEHCHSANGIRHELTLEQLGTAQFLVKQGQMPPFPFHISDQERQQLLETF